MVVFNRMEQFHPACVVGAMLGHPECLNSTKRGYTMPAFTFEKISPPATHGHSQPTQIQSTQVLPNQPNQRSGIIQILGRFVEARVTRVERLENATLRRRDVPPPK
ncbi:hypothetical protein [Tardiphaga sp. 813_E8_N1_3]|uniref:hypothetical protein n=1 Tax=Tardiphaga sp. 813_E8_N1_3 TaxID=3240760 RepID=UPI003F230795